MPFECDSNLAAADCLPATNLNWSIGGTGLIAASQWANASNIASVGWSGFTDLNGDGKSDFWYFLSGTGQMQVMLFNPPFPDLLSTVTNGLGAQTIITYKPLTDNSVYTKGSGAVSPQQDFQGPMYVVSQYTTSDGVGGNYQMNYAYSGARVDVWGRGLLGFARVNVTDTRTGIIKETDYNQTWPYTGTAAATCQYTITEQSTCQSRVNPVLSSTINSPAKKTYGSANAYYYFVYTAQSVQKNYELPANGGALVTSVTTNNTFYSSCDTNDIFCDISIITVITTAGGNSFTKTTQNAYDYSGVSNWVLGRLANTTVTSRLPNGSQLTRESAFTYHPSGLLWKEVIEPNGNTGSITNIKQTTTYAYDGFGNKSTATVTGDDGISRPATAVNTASTGGVPYAYSAGRFETGLTNAVSQNETRTYDARFGTVATLTGPNNLQTSWLYDTFGRKSKETRADNTTTT